MCHAEGDCFKSYPGSKGRYLDEGLVDGHKTLSLRCGRSNSQFNGMPRDLGHTDGTKILQPGWWAIELTEWATYRKPLALHIASLRPVAILLRDGPSVPLKVRQ